MIYREFGPFQAGDVIGFVDGQDRETIREVVSTNGHDVTYWRWTEDGRELETTESKAFRRLGSRVVIELDGDAR